MLTTGHLTGVMEQQIGDNVSTLVNKFREYSIWRSGVAIALERYRAWVTVAQLSDAASDQRLSRALSRLAEDKLSIAFVAEFSRGKSELINAIFFADYGQRILPSSAGRTTMCPTELLYDETFPPSIRLLPIETRAESQSTRTMCGRYCRSIFHRGMGCSKRLNRSV
jgi:hypothetical protein